ncbi:MAG: hypothetical protein IPI30_09475 [Saprospiraceae bacterium]|nr:hypothetical protein [Candidatus Vicinibacter affinis]
MRTFSAKVNEKDFDEKTKMPVRKKFVDRRDYLDTLGYDICGKLIDFNDYRDTNSLHGWEIDTLNRVSNAGRDKLRKPTRIKAIMLSGSVARFFNV